MSLFNFQCKKCNLVFDIEVEDPRFSILELVPNFENNVICPQCGPLLMFEFELTKLGRTQVEQHVRQRITDKL